MADKILIVIDMQYDFICLIYDKPTFGCTCLAQDLLVWHEKKSISSIENHTKQLLQPCVAARLFVKPKQTES